MMHKQPHTSSAIKESHGSALAWGKYHSVMALAADRRGDARMVKFHPARAAYLQNVVKVSQAK